MKGRQQSPHEDMYIINSNGCHIWQRSCSVGGYPQITYSRRVMSAHRYFYMRHHNKVIPPRTQIDHLCKNKLCVNPLHLEAVTQHENLRHAGMCKLTTEQVSEIRSLDFTGIKQKELAKQFGVTQQQISRILNRVDRKEF